MDALLPPEMALRAEEIGIRKARLPVGAVFVLAVLAGAFIALGGIFSTTAVAGAQGHLPFGVIRLLAGVVFSLGLILVVVGGAELFTGNNLIVMAWASRRVSTRRLLANWLIVYLGNFAGALATAVIVYLAGQYRFGEGAVGAAALAIAHAKVQLGFVESLCLGMLCNALVCLAVWLTYSARSTTDRVLVIVPPIAAFVAAGFEHSIANMYFIPVAILIRDGAPPAFWDAIQSHPEAFPHLNWGNCLWKNLLPVTIGNVIGGAGMVGAVYWFIYLRPAHSAVAQPAPRSSTEESAADASEPSATAAR